MKGVASTSREMRSRMVKAGWIPEIVAAMQDSPMDMHLNTWCCDVLTTLALNDDTHAQMIAEAGAAQLAVDAVQNTPTMLENLGADGHPAYAETQYTVGESCQKLGDAL